MIPAFNILSALAALVAARFWFAAGRTPPPTPSNTADAGKGWGDEYFSALRASARANRVAASCAGVAALLQAVVGVSTALGVR